MNQAHTKKDLWLTYALPLVILACFAIAYWPVFQKLERQWSAGDNSYGYLIVPLFAYLLYDLREKRKEKREKSEGRRTTDEGRGKIDDGPMHTRVPHPSEAVILLPSVQPAGGFAFGAFSWSYWGLIPVVLSVFLIIIGELGSVRALMFMGIWGCVVGLCIMLYGKRTRRLAFPLLILFFMVPLPPFVNQVLTFKLKMAASKLSVIMLRAAGVSVLLEGNIIDIGVDKLQVVDACSGLRYFMPMILMALLVAYFFVKGRWRWTVLLFLIVPLSVFVNAVRIWMSAVLTASGHPELARNLFHDFSGWLMFMIAGMFLVAAALVLKRLGKEEREKRKEKSCADGRQGRMDDGRGKMEENQRSEVGSQMSEDGGQKSEVRSQRTEVRIKDESQDYGLRIKDYDKPNQSNNATNVTNKTNKTHLTNLKKPVLITVILCLIFAGSGWALKQIPSSGNLPQRTCFEHFPMNIGDWQGKREYISEEILNGLWADDYVTARYYKPGSPNMIYLLIPFYNYQVTNHTAHAPQACILGGGFSLVRSKAHPVRVAPDREIEIMTMILEKGDTRLLGSYFFLQKGRVITSPWMNKYYLIWDGITKQRTDGALVRAEMTVAPGQPMDEAYAQLEEFITKLWPILPDYIPS